ncbi:MAG: PDZ domain-containing protein, partial [Pirellulales bacterium]
GVPGAKVVTNRPPAWRGIRVDYATALDPLKLTDAIGSNAIDPAGCVMVGEVEPKSVAAKAGIRAGMFISHVGGQRVRTPIEFYEAAQQAGDSSDTLDIKLTQPILPARDDEAKFNVPGVPPLKP